MKKILLVGGEGYIGSVLCPALLKNGYQVCSFDILAYGNGSGVLGNLGWAGAYHFIRGDIRSDEELTRAMADCDAVVLLAGLVGDPITKKYPRESASINHSGVETVIRIAAREKIRKLIFVSTCSNYGLIPTDVVADEDWPTNPLSTYAKAKIAAEKLSANISSDVDLDVTILRFATAFGLAPRMRFDLTISEFVRDPYLGNRLTVYDADTWRPYCHVNDFARLIIKVLRDGYCGGRCEIFNAGGTVNNFTKRMIVDLILKKLPGRDVYFQKDGQDPRNYRVDFTRVSERFGFEPAFTVEDGIDELIWALENSLFPIRSGEERERYGNYELDKTLLLD